MNKIKYLFYVLLISAILSSCITPNKPIVVATNTFDPLEPIDSSRDAYYLGVLNFCLFIKWSNSEGKENSDRVKELAHCDEFLLPLAQKEYWYQKSPYVTDAYGEGTIKMHLAFFPTGYSTYYQGMWDTCIWMGFYDVAKSDQLHTCTGIVDAIRDDKYPNFPW